MASKKRTVKRASKGVVLAPREGRVYDLGRGSRAVFKADDVKYSISEEHMGPISAWFRARPAADARAT
jgi:hypothetical protein